MNAALALLSRDWFGLCLAAAVLIVGLVCVEVSRSPSAQLLGAGLLVLGGLGTAGALRQVIKMVGIRARYPPPGRRVDVGGFAVHVLAEGLAHGRPPVVWLPGAHLGGFALHHLHRRWRELGRSILIDRPGTGWSDTGTFPRTTAKEAEELIRALERAGEVGPFVFAGHSFGGLLAANMARRYPEHAAAVVLIDATPLETIVFGPRLASLNAMRHNAIKELLRRVFGLGSDPIEQQRRQHPEAQALWDQMVSTLGPDVQPALAAESGAGAMCAAASIYGELTPEGAARAAWETVVYDGELEGLSVFLVAPRNMAELESMGDLRSLVAGQGDASSRAALRIARFYARSRERYLATSSSSKRVYAPAGTGHNFPYETPEFVIQVVQVAVSAKAGQTRL